MTLGTAAPGMSPAAQPGRWNILVCSDLGFTSKNPQQVRIAEWNEFVSCRGVVLSGTVPDILTGGDKPLYVELAVRSMKDFSSDALAQNVPLCAAFSTALSALRGLLGGKIGSADADAVIAKAGLPQSEKQRLTAMLGPAKGTEQPKQTATAAKSPVDRILSMVDANPAPAQTKNAGKRGFAEALAESVSGPREDFNRDELSGYIDECEQRIRAQVAAIENLPFFALRKASWTWLMTLAKAVGRKPEAQVTVYSAESNDMPDTFGRVLGACVEQGFPPDIVVWDFDVSFTNAHVKGMTSVAETADLHKCMVIAPLAADEPLLSGISGRQTIAYLFEDTRFLPYKKLRSSPHARCLCLCAPPLAGGRAAWFAALRWAEMLLQENNPVAARGQAARGESIFSSGPVFACRIAPGVATEAAAMGLTFFEEPPTGLFKAATVVSAEAADAGFTSLCFNLFVNRVIRRCGACLLSAGSGAKRDEIAAVLQEQVQRECAACGIASGGDTVGVRESEGRAIEVSVDSETEIAGHPVRFSFSM